MHSPHPQLVLQMVLNHHLGAGNQIWFPAIATRALNHVDISLAPVLFTKICLFFSFMHTGVLLICMSVCSAQGDRKWVVDPLGLERCEPSYGVM